MQSDAQFIFQSFDPQLSSWPPGLTLADASLGKQVAGPSKPPAGCAPDAVKLFVGNIPKHYTEDQLIPLFESVGTVVELSITRDKVSKTSKGSAFLWYSTAHAAEAAIQTFNMRHSLPEISGREMRPLAVRPANPKSNTARGGPSSRQQVRPPKQQLQALPLQLQSLQVLQQQPVQQTLQQQPLQQLFALEQEPSMMPTFTLAQPAAAPVVQPTLAVPSESVTLTIQLLYRQLLSINEHLYSVHTMSGAQISAVPLPDGLASLTLKGTQQQVDQGRQMLSLLLSSMV